MAVTLGRTNYYTYSHPIITINEIKVDLLKRQVKRNMSHEDPIERSDFS